MKRIIKSLKLTKIRIFILITLIFCVILLLKFLKPYFIYKANEDELKSIISEIAEDNRLKAFRDEPNRYYDGYDAIDSSEISSDLSSNIDKLFEDKNITYVGWGCPINGFYCWNQLYIRIADYGNKEKYLMYCEDENSLPEFSEYGPVKCNWMTGDWYCVTIKDTSQVKTP